MKVTMSGLLLPAVIVLTIASAACLNTTAQVPRDWTPVPTTRPIATATAKAPTPTVVGTATSNPSSTGLNPKNGPIQTTEAGPVTISLKWDGVVGDRLGFDVSMDTHSISLDAYDLGKTSVLRDDAGKEYVPVAWTAPPGGHHRSGKLGFPVPDSLTQGIAKYLEITIKGTAGGDRVFKWDLQ